MTSLNISTVIGCGLSECRQLPLIKQAGFDGFFAADTSPDSLKLCSKMAGELGLVFETVHAPFKETNHIWEPGEEGEEYLSSLKELVDLCSQIQVDKCIVHVTMGNTVPAVSQIGLDRFGQLCDYAKNRQVHICFENLEPHPHLEAVLAHIEDSYHGFCWDIGHNICYTPHIDWTKKYGSRLKCLHIHDNKGVTQPGNIDYRDDLHLLPFDGSLDWDWFAGKLRECHYEGPITLEVSNQGREEYRNMTLEQYLTAAYERGCRIREKFESVL